VDRFGNCVTNISRGDIAERFGQRPVSVSAGGRSVGAIRGTYGQVASGEALALCDSMDLLEVAVSGGRACDVLGLAVGDEIRVSESEVIK